MDNSDLEIPKEFLDKPYLLFDDENRDIISTTKGLLKNLYEKIAFSKTLQNIQTELVFDDLDEEQIWSQLEKRVSSICKRSEVILEKLGSKSLEDKKEKLPSKKNQDLSPPAEEEESLDEELEGAEEELEGAEEEDDSNANLEEDEIEGEENIDEENEEESENNEAGEDFNNEAIDYDDMENFLEAADQEGDQMAVDLDDEDGDEELEEEEMQGDKIGAQTFFKNKEADEEDMGDEDIENDVFDNAREMFSKDQIPNDDILENSKQKFNPLDGEIDRLEAGLLGKKSWQMQGEIKANQRPLNSLLEEHLDFKSGLKLDADLPKEVTADLEKVIKQRILDEAWDDPIRYEGPDYMRENFNSTTELKYEKSEKGLAELYEDEFKKNILNIPTNSEDDKLKKEIELLFRQVCYNLDAMSNFSFTPKPYVKPAEIISNAPSIIQEEKIPIFMNEKQRKAPQELYNAKNIALENKDEMTHDEKRQKRRQTKRNIRSHLKHKLMKTKIKKLLSLGQTKFEYNQVKKGRAKLKEELKKKSEKSVKFSSSSQFFSNLQKSIENPGENKAGKKKAFKTNKSKGNQV